jgi:hypothetical protein
MTGDNQCQRIGGAGASHRSNRFGRSDSAGDFRVGGGGSRRSFPERLPDPLLKGGAPKIEQKIEGAARGFDQTNHLRQVSSQLMVSAEQSGVGKSGRQFASNGFRVVAQENGTDPPITPRDQDQPQGTLADRVVELR